MCGQLKNRYPNDVWQEIIGNCDLRINMGTTDVLTAKYFAESLGISSVETTSIRKSASIEGKIEEYGQQNISTLKRNLLNIDEILRIPSNKLLVIIRGNNPLLLNKIIYKEHSLSNKLKSSSISQYKKNIIIKTPKCIKQIKNDIHLENSFDNF